MTSYLQSKQHSRFVHLLHVGFGMYIKHLTVTVIKQGGYLQWRTCSLHTWLYIDTINIRASLAIISPAAMECH